jgi:hypothetical protein
MALRPVRLFDLDLLPKCAAEAAPSSWPGAVGWFAIWGWPWACRRGWQIGSSAHTPSCTVVDLFTCAMVHM